MVDVGLEGLAPAPPSWPRANAVVRPVVRSLTARAAGNRVFLAAVLCAAVATTWAALTHSMLLYDDAQSHLNIARHVTDGLRPGLVQLGSVWLPLPHILMAPLVAINWMWHSGAGGAIVGGACFIYSAFRIYTLVDELTRSRVGAWCAFAVYVLNLNVLYLQSTALTEPVLLAFVVGAVFHLARWLRTRRLREMVIAGVLTFCATLSRYDGWAMCGAAIVAVVAWTWLETRDAKQAEANGVIFGVIASYGIVLWLLYNLIIWHDPLYFMHSTYSAQAQQGALAHFGELATKGDFVRSALTYGWCVIDVLGPPVAVTSAIGIAFLLLWKYSGGRRSLIVLAVLAAPVVFNVISLWLGQTTILVPQVPPHGLYDDRYGVMALPLAAVTLGVVAGQFRRFAPLVAAVPAVAAGLMAIGTPITIQDGRVGESSAVHGRALLSSAVLRRNYRGGEILADDSQASPFMFESGLDLKEFVTVGFEPWYKNALRAPAANVAWVVTVNDDAVAGDMAAHPGRFRRFKLVVTDVRPDAVVRLYKREGT